MYQKYAYYANKKRPGDNECHLVILLFPRFIHTDRREAQRFKHLDQGVGRIQARHAGDIVLRRYPSDQEAVRSCILLAGHRVDHEVHPSVADDVHHVVLLALFDLAGSMYIQSFLLEQVRRPFSRIDAVADVRKAFCQL